VCGSQTQSTCGQPWHGGRSLKFGKIEVARLISLLDSGQKALAMVMLCIKCTIKNSLIIGCYLLLGKYGGPEKGRLVFGW
jgi:hypothetical protein